MKKRKFKTVHVFSPTIFCETEEIHIFFRFSTADVTY